MVEGVGNLSALAREALRAAQRHASEVAPLAEGTQAPHAQRTGGAQESAFAEGLAASLQNVDQSARTAGSIPEALLTGKINDFHEIAVQLKSAELSFKFAMEIRNKLIDAYREIMRMSV